MSELVINSATMSCCGASKAGCCCQRPATNQGSGQADSDRAVEATVDIGDNDMKWHAGRAVAAAAAGDHSAAAELHRKVAGMHYKAGGQATVEESPDDAEAHWDAAAKHMKASSVHAAQVVDDQDDGDDDEPADNRRGARGQRVANRNRRRPTRNRRPSPSSSQEDCLALPTMNYSSFDRDVPAGDSGGYSDPNHDGYWTPQTRTAAELLGMFEEDDELARGNRRRLGLDQDIDRQDEDGDMPYGDQHGDEYARNCLLASITDSADPVARGMVCNALGMDTELRQDAEPLSLPAYDFKQMAREQRRQEWNGRQMTRNVAPADAYLADHLPLPGTY